MYSFIKKDQRFRANQRQILPFITPSVGHCKASINDSDGEFGK